MREQGNAKPIAAGDAPLPISMIMTCYCEEESVEAFNHRLCRAIADLPLDVELIYVDDGSRDGTLDILRGLAQADPRIKLIALDRNNGQWAAMTWGFLHSEKRAVLFMDVDLEIAPEEVPAFVDAYQSGADVVSAHRLNRADRLRRIVLSKIGNFCIRHALRIQLTDLGSGLKIFDRRLLESCALSQQNILNPIDIFAQPARVSNIPVAFSPRQGGQSHWPVRQVIWRFLNSFREHLQRRRPAPLRWLRRGLLVSSALALVAAAVVQTLWGANGLNILVPVAQGLLAATALASALAFRFFGRAPMRKGACGATLIASGGRILASMDRSSVAPEVSNAGLAGADVGGKPDRSQSAAIDLENS